MAITPHRATTDDLLRPLFADLPGSGWDGRMAGTNPLRPPAANMVETGDTIRVTVELPGLRPEDVEVTLEDNLLTISGEKQKQGQEEDRERRWHLAERRYGRFSRSFVLPRDLEQEQIQARFEDGVLSVVIPKSERVRPRRIPIQGGNGRQTVGSGEGR